MKPRFVISVAVLLVAMAIFLVTRPSEVVEQPLAESREKIERTIRPGPGLTKSSDSPARVAARQAWDLAKPRVSPHSTSSEEHLEWIDEQRADLLEKSHYFDDPAILREVMASLRSPEPELRVAALEAVINLGSRDAIPYLEQAAVLAETPEEQGNLIEAAEYLKLPTIFEGRALRKKEQEEAAAEEAAAGE